MTLKKSPLAIYIRLFLTAGQAEAINSFLRYLVLASFPVGRLAGFS